MADIWTPIRYGWSHIRWAKIAGIPTIFSESPIGKTLPAGFTAEAAALNLGASAKIGAVVDRDKGIGAGFAATIEILDCAEMSAYMTRAPVVRRLTSSISSSAAAIPVDSEAGLTSPVYIGTETIAFGSTAAGLLNVTDRGVAGLALPHNRGSSASLVTSVPRYWRGRLVTIYAQPVDPTGYAPGSTLESLSVAIWQGYITDEPLRLSSGAGWRLPALPLDRMLARPIRGSLTGAVVSSESRFVVDNDTLDIVITRRKISNGSTTLYSANLTPLADDGFVKGDLISISEAEAAIASAWAAWVSTQGVGAVFGGIVFWAYPLTPGAGFQWKIGKGDRLPYVAIQATGTDYEFQVSTSWFGKVYDLPIGPILGATTSSAVEYTYLQLKIGYNGSIYDVNAYGKPSPTTTPAIAVQFDGGDPGNLPAGGTFLVGDQLYRYQSSLAQSTLGRVVFLNSFPIGVVAIGAPKEGDTVTVRPDNAGTLADCILRLCHSTGEAALRGAYDVLPSILGLGLPTSVVDDSQIAALVGDGWWALLPLAVSLDDQSVADVLGGALALGGLALTVTGGIAADAKLRAVRTAAAVGGVDFAIDDSHLVSFDSVTVQTLAVSPPNSVSVELRSGADVLQTLTINDAERSAAEGVKNVTFSLPTEDRSTATAASTAWAAQRVIGDGQASIVELDVVPWVLAEVGAAVSLDLSVPGTWDLDTGTAGISTVGRVIGREVVDLVVTLTVLVDGLALSRPISPAAPILSVTGGATTPSAMTVHRDYFEILSAAYANRDGAYLRLLYYDPGEGAEDLAEYVNVDGVTDTGTVCSLSIASYSVTISATATTGYLSWPETANADVWQASWLHDDDGRFWA